jgi:hypothetical protein
MLKFAEGEKSIFYKVHLTSGWATFLRMLLLLPTTLFLSGRLAHNKETRH